MIIFQGGTNRYMTNHLVPLGLSVVASALGYIVSENKRKNIDNKKGFNMSSKLADPIADVPDFIKNNKYPAKRHNLNVKEHLVGNIKSDIDSVGFLIAGNPIEPIKYCDTTKEFRQERYFSYLSGIDIPSSLIFYDCKTEKLIAFLPEIEWDDVVWGGMPMEPKEALEKFDVDEVYYIGKLSEVLEKYQNIETLYTTDLDNFESIKFDEKYSKIVVPSNKDFFYAMDEARSIKDEYEIEILRYVAKITDNCHYAVMSALPIEINELHIEAEFGYHAKRQGARTLGYDPICCSGPACGTLHYVKNSESLIQKDSTLIDAGAEWMDYVSDVTRCFPISGKFTKEHREIYEAVLDMQSQTMELMKPGAKWDDLHIMAHKILIKHLIQLGILKGDQYSEEEIFESRVSCAFYPHGLGHLMGLDVHDVAGFPNYEDSDPYFKFLRLRRELKTGMVLTNEPGCYFNDHLVEEFLTKHPERSKMVNFDVLEKYKYVGGVRIEDDILITKEGYENFTGITSDPDEIEKIIQKGLSKKRSDFHIIV